MTRFRAAAVLCVVSALGGCTMQSQSPPDLAGPSGFGISVSLTSSPEVLPRDGSSRATITINARDEVSNSPLVGQLISLTTVPSTASVSAHEVRTGSAGRAAVSVTAPPADASDDAITVIASLVDGVSDRVAPRTLSIGLIFDGTQEAAARFSVTPAQPKVGEQATFDASASRAPDGSVIKMYIWDFGDGTTSTTTTPTIHKTYDEARVYAVELAVVDNLNHTSRVGRNVTVVP